MILIAGVQPKTKTVDPAPRRCPACGLHQARLERVDHYFSLFFIPLIRVKKGEAMLVCDRCGGRPLAAGPARSTPQMCRQCGRALEESFQFCPHCGQRQ